MAMWNRCAICGRAIPVGELCYGVKNWRGDPDGGDTICRDCLVPENAPTLTPPNEPLTFEERREMGRKPVWLDDEKTFGILQFWDDNNVDAVFLDPSGCIRVKSVIGKKIYRRPPEGEENT